MVEKTHSSRELETTQVQLGQPYLESYREQVRDFLIVPPEAPGREAVYLSGDLYTFLATGEETGGQFVVFDFLVPPGGGPPLHIHYLEDECLYVLEGEVELQMGEQIIVGTPGTFVYLPRYRPHRFKNSRETSATLLALLNPSGIDDFFREVGYPVNDRSTPPPPMTPETIQRFVEVGARTKRGVIVQPGDSLPSTEGLPDFLVVLPDAPGHESFSIGGGTYTYLATYEETNGQYVLFNAFLPPEARSEQLPVHSQNQVLYVLDGKLSLQLEEQTTVVTPGTFVYLPSSKSFSFQNLEKMPVTMLLFAFTNIPTEVTT